MSKHFSFSELMGSYTGAAKKPSANRAKRPFPDEVHRAWHLASQGRAERPAAAAAAAERRDEGRVIAVCLCVVDKLPHEAIWRRWLEDAEHGGDDEAGRWRGELRIHAKHPEALRAQSPWVAERTLARSFCPEWNDVRIVRAMLALASAALEADRDARISHVVFGTESCVPVVSLRDAARAFAAERRSWLDVHVAPPNRWLGAMQWGAVDRRVVPERAVRKALPGWVALSRAHAAEIVALPSALGGDLWPAFERAFAPEELYFATCLALVGALGAEAARDEVARRSVTHAAYPPSAGEERAHPMRHDALDAALLARVRRETPGCVLARKFSAALGVDDWARVVLGEPAAPDAARAPVASPDKSPSRAHREAADDGEIVDEGEIDEGEIAEDGPSSRKRRHDEVDAQDTARAAQRHRES